jgi:ATP-dependent protease ClpP protease subunit
MELGSMILAYRDDEGELQINTDIDEASALVLEKALDLFFAYYRYPRACLSINSNGGLTVALEHMLGIIERWRRVGREIRTVATFRAGSAAALLLSMGEVGSRQVHRHTTLLYHHGRIVGGDSQITAGRAGHLATVLQSGDHRLIKRLANHVASGFGGATALAVEGRARCDLLMHLQSKLNGSHQEASNGPGVRTKARGLRTVTAMYKACQERDSIAPYATALSRRFEQDTSMEPHEAYVLGLIDGVIDVPDLVPRAASLKPHAHGNNSSVRLVA